MVRPRIGVTASARGGRAMWLFNRLALYRAGATPIRLVSGDAEHFSQMDALVIGGGDDISATLYGGRINPSIRIDPDRDLLEVQALQHAFRRGIPVLGICRGAQMMNVFLGGSLHEDIYEAFPGIPRVRTTLPRKSVTIEPDSRLASILNTDRCRVNALHHQSVDRLGEGVRVVARDDSGIVQAVETTDDGRWIGVQWHPEFLVFDRRQQRLFRQLVEQVAYTPVSGAVAVR